ncbi:heparinase II/III domain-containing protein [Glutamicibacter sp. AOP38-B1-38]|uniref:heparinase II/III domain-containing protein n=1 Tax=Glutamicibacter sp. AOP38-B1-38 TaxID=3457680 RepID=UPI0040338CD2
MTQEFSGFDGDAFMESLTPVEDELYKYARSALQSRGADPDEVVASLAIATLPSLKGWFTISRSRQDPRVILASGWKFAKFEPVPVSTLTNWAKYGEEHRSWGFHLHAFEFMDPLLRAADETKDPRWLQEAVKIALGWIKLHRQLDDEVDTMVWYDMSQSLRMPRLIALAMRAARVPTMHEHAVVLAEALAWHLDELHKDRAFNPRNNHGFYTAVSQVHAAKHLGMFPDAVETATEGSTRLALMARSQFGPDGVHLEHSPDYHRMLLNSFELAVRDGLINDDEIRSRIVRAAHVLGWMVQPDGTIVQFGDSPATNVVSSNAESIDAATRFILTDGKFGLANDRELAAFADGGYAFVRSPQPKNPGELAKTGYLAFSAGFHSRAHKHADDLNVIWYDRGHQILTDAGRFGYGDLLPADSELRKEGFYYSSPERQYVESTIAHNTLMMDGENHRRVRRTPYGSALGECVAKSGRFDLSGRVRHTDYVHRRRIIYVPGEELRLLDAVHSAKEESREAIVWLNINGAFELADVSGGTVKMTLDDAEHPLSLTLSGPGKLVAPVRGQKLPMRGWRSRVDRDLEPTWSIGFRVKIETRANLETVIKLS